MSVSIRKSFSVGLVSLCVLACALLLLSASALAAEPPKVEEELVTHVSATAAMLEAKVNPEQSATTYRFEYDTSEYSSSAAHGQSVPLPEGEAGEGSEGVVVHVIPQNLKPGITYHFRVVATNSAKPTPEVAYGEDESFTTRPEGSAFELPDGRAWELVSPPPGPNGVTVDVTPLEAPGGMVQAAEGGGKFTYLANGATEAGAAGLANESQVLSVRGADGWSSRDLATSHYVSTGLAINEQEYDFFSPDLSLAILDPLGSGSTGGGAEAQPLSPAARNNAKTIYLRANAPFSPGGQGVYGQTVAEGDYLPLVTGCPPVASTEKCSPTVEEYANVPLGTEFGENQLSFEGATPNLSNVVLRSGVPLTENVTTTNGGLWEWAGGRLRLVGVLPDKEQVNPFLGGYGAYNVRGAISSDGSRIVWTREQYLYMQDMSLEDTVQLDLPEQGAGGGERPQAYFQFASSDGSKVFFTDEAQLTVGADKSTAAGEAPDLYECAMVEVEEAGKEVLKCDLHDLTVDPGGHAGVLANSAGTILGASEDGSYVYFAASGALSDVANAQGERAAAGKCQFNTSSEQCNLYVEHYNDGEWKAPVFIARLSSADAPDWAGGIEVSGDLEETTSRVSPNGEYLAFMSLRPLTGYDNRDAITGKPDEEVYLYRAPSATAPLGTLVCASCNPTGERPIGVENSPAAEEANGEAPLLIDSQKNWRGGPGLAGDIPGWTAFTEDHARYQSRYLSNSGRLFFNSPDSLVSQATNGLTDVYEYEPVGVGGEAGCRTSSSTFSARADGCVGLISSGSSRAESVFLDASESGNDVFFMSAAQLVGADKTTGAVVYDAHVCSASSPCPVEASSPLPCTTAEACRAAPTPQPSIFGAPSSATFAGAGNITSPPATSVKSTLKGLTRAQKLANALKACKKKPRGSKRASCERRVRKRYVVQAKKSARTDRGAK
jgi:hypothetical protein